MEKFFAIYRAPAAALAEWEKTDPEVRKAAEEKMKEEWDQWMAEHRASMPETVGLGKTKSITPDGVADIRNDLMLYSIVEAASQEDAAAIFVGHPHLQILGSTIEVMTVNPL